MAAILGMKSEQTQRENVIFHQPVNANLDGFCNIYLGTSGG